MRNPFHQARQRPQTAFTIVELVAVVLVLAVLAAAALPRFLDSRQAAHEASVRAVGEAFREAVHFVHARWRLDGGVPGAENLSGFGLGNVDVNANGWPTDTDGRDFIPPVNWVGSSAGASSRRCCWVVQRSPHAPGAV